MMAFSAGLRTASQAFISAGPGDSQATLRGEVLPQKASQNSDTLAPYVGLPNGKALDEYFSSSETFAPVYNKFYQNVKFSRYDSDKTYDGWEDVDYYADLLFRLTVLNKTYRSGLFRGKNMTTAEIQVRLWACMVRARSRRTGLEKKKRKQETGSSSKNADAKVAKVDGQTSPRSNSNPSPNAEMNPSAFGLPPPNFQLPQLGPSPPVLASTQPPTFSPSSSSNPPVKIRINSKHRKENMDEVIEEPKPEPRVWPAGTTFEE